MDNFQIWYKKIAEAMGYVVTNTLFKKRKSHLVTYESGGNKTAVDMILIKRDHKKRIMNTKVIPGEECVHGHHFCGDRHAFKG